MTIIEKLRCDPPQILSTTESKQLLQMLQPLLTADGVYVELDYRKAGHGRKRVKMASQKSLEIAARCWCNPRTSSTTMDPVLAEVFAEVLDAAVKELHHGMESAWGLIANAYGGDWDKASPKSGWKKAAERWRDEAWSPVASTTCREKQEKPR